MRKVYLRIAGATTRLKFDIDNINSIFQNGTSTVVIRQNNVIFTITCSGNTATILDANIEKALELANVYRLRHITETTPITVDVDLTGTPVSNITPAAE